MTAIVSSQVWTFLTFHRFCCHSFLSGLYLEDYKLFLTGGGGGGRSNPANAKEMSIKIKKCFQRINVCV